MSRVGRPLTPHQDSHQPTPPHSNRKSPLSFCPRNRGSCQSDLERAGSRSPDWVVIGSTAAVKAAPNANR